MAISKRLVVQFLGDSSQLQGVYSTVTKDAQKFNKEIKNHGVSMQAVGKTMLAVGGAIVGALAATVVAVSKTGVEIDKMSKTTGVSREEIQKLGYAALQEHASMEQLSAGLVKLSKNMYDANMGTGEAKDTFEELEISVKKSDGTLRSSSDVLLDIADKFKGMTNETEISGAAMKLFGKSGAELVPFLRMGRDGIEELKKEAERLGIVMSEDSVKNMKAFDDSMTAVKAGVGGFATQIASALIPYMNKLADGLKAALEWFNKIPKPMRDAVTVGTALVGALSLVAGIIVTAVIPALIAMGAATALATGGISLLVAGLVYLGSTNQKATAIIWDVWDRAIAFLYTAWKGLETSCWALIREMLKALNTLTGWIPGWGKGLNAAILAVEKERQASLLAANNGWNTVIKGTYNEHYNWLVAKNKKKNADIQKNEDSANVTKNQKTKEQLEKEKKAAEAAAQERLNNEKDWAEKRFNETHNELERLNHEEELALSKSNLTAKAKADIVAYYDKKRTDLAKEEAKKLADNEKDWADKVFEITHTELENLDKAEQEALSKEDLTEKAKTDIKAYYTQRRKELGDAEVKKALETQNELLTRAQDYSDRIYKLTHDEYDNRLKTINSAETKELKQTNLTEQEKTDIIDYYTKLRLKVYEDEKDSYYKAGLQMAQTFTSFTDSIRDGSTTIGEALQNLLISIINTIEQQVIAKAIAAEAIAYADSWWSLGASLTSLATIASKVWPAVAALEALKFGVSGLAEGGVTTGPTYALIGEGRSNEAVLPLSDEVFARIGEGIVKNQITNNNNTSTNNNNPTVINNTTNYELGRYVDKSGLKRLARDIQPILTAEDKRKGKK